MKTGELLTQRLELVYRWYEGMVNPDTGMFEYLYIPQADDFIREKSPIRDIASVWDVEMLSAFLKRHELRPLVEKSLRHYGNYLVEREGYLILDRRRLEEPSSIAHSAFMILALLHAPPPIKTRQIAALAEGILRQQKQNGSYKVYFHDLPDRGEELYAGEAMLALLETYRHLQDTRYLQSVERGFSHYDVQYFRRARVADDMLVFFANWQSQACRLLFECTQSAGIKQDVAGYVCRMHDQIIERGFYENVERHQPNRCRWRWPAPWRASMTHMRSYTHQKMSAPNAIDSASARGWHTCSGCNVPTTERKGNGAVSACPSKIGRRGSTSPAMRPMPS